MMVHRGFWRRVGLASALVSTWVLSIHAGHADPAGAPVASFAAPSAALAGEIPNALVEAEAEAAKELLVPGLIELADWCDGEKLYGSRNEVYELILQYDPDHGVARKGLKYSRDSQGNWVLPRENKVKNRNPEAEEQFSRLRSEKLAPYRTAVVGLMREHDLSPFSREGLALLDRILTADPDDPQVRRILRQKKLDDTWVLEETFLARGRRVELDQMARLALGAAEAVTEKGELNETDTAVGIAWKLVLVTPEVRVVGMVEKKEMEQIAQASTAVGDYFREVFDTDAENWPGATIYVLPDESLKNTFVDHYPDLGPANREFIRGLTSAGIPGTAHVAQWDPDPLRRLDSATRHTLGSYLQKTFSIDATDGWAWEGFGQYFTWRLIGTRLTWYVTSMESNARGRTEMRARLMAPDADWREIAIDMLNTPTTPTLEALLPKGVNDMTAEDMLLAHVLTAYLVEGERAEPGVILQRIGKGEDDQAVLEELLAMDVHMLQDRLRLWLEEEEPARDLDPSQTVVAFGQPDLTVKSSKRKRAKTEGVPWLELPPGAEGSLYRKLEKLPAADREVLLARCVQAARATGAPQVESIAKWTAGSENETGERPLRTEFFAHDPKVYRGGPPRKLIQPGEKKWDRFREWLPPEREAPWTRTVEYEFPTGKIVAVPPDPKDTTWPFQNLLLGILPGQDLAEARIQAQLDAAGAVRKEAFYFAHLYCDRDAKAYEGITLYDVWANEVQLEVPDPDARAYAKLIWDEDSVPDPLTDQDHLLWYPRIEESLKRYKARLLIARALASTWFVARPALEGGYEVSIDAFHATLALEEEDGVRVADRYERDGERFVHAALAQIESLGKDGWNAGNARRDALAAGQAEIRRAVADVLVEAGLLPGLD